MMTEDDNTSEEVNDEALSEETITVDDSTAETTDEVTEEAPKPKKSAQERIDELTRARREAERDAEYWRAKATQAPPPVEAKPEPKGDGRPDPAEYAAGEYDPAYVDALVKWTVKETLSSQLAEREQKTEAQKRQDTFNERIEAAKAKYPDFAEKVFEGGERKDWVCTKDMLETMQESELGAELAYHLASNPAEAQRIASLTPRAQAMAIGRLEAGLSGSTKPKPKIVSDAPDPATTTRGTSGRFQVAPDTNDFAAFDKAF